MSTSSLPATNSATSVAGASNVTSQQVLGIDEGDIVKAIGDTLLVLCQGVLYAVSLDGSPTVRGQMRVQDEGGDENGWIDEMLVHVESRRIVITGFVEGPDGDSYTLYHLFELSSEGQLIRGDAIYMQSADYFDDENYATRIVGDQLVAYSVHYISPGFELDPDDFEGMSDEEIQQYRAEARWDRQLPAIRVGTGGRFQRTWAPRRVFREQGRQSSTMHAITSCNLARNPVRCQSRGVLADGEPQLFVSETASYLWMNYMSYEVPRRHQDEDDDWYEDEEEGEGGVVPLYRFPHGSTRVQSVAVVGLVEGALSFAENGGTLRVVVDIGENAENWRAEEEELELRNGEPAEEVDALLMVADPRIALLSVPIARFDRPLTRGAYRTLPGQSTDAMRFVGNRHLAYSDDSSTYIHDYTSSVPTLRVDQTGHRLDPLGSDGLLISWANDADLDYLTLDLRGVLRVTEHRRLPNANTSETRTHGFFYRPDASGGSFGMPLISENEQALVAYFNLRGFQTQLLGGLHSNNVETACVNSCIDWYGNARPIFWQGRIFALLGAELIEGQRQAGGLVEIGRAVMRPELREGEANE